MSEVRDDQPGDDKNPDGIEKILSEAEVLAGQSPEEGGDKKGAPPSSSGDVEKLKAELEESKEKNLRLYAEFDNFRRRTARESFEMMATANARLIEKLTEVLDNFQRAFEAQGKGSAEDFEKGVKMIYGRFKEILDGEGLEEIDPSGTEFDPNLHDAMLQQPSESVPENHVIQTVAKGYKLKAKILKHAKVIVSQGPPPPEGGG